MNLIEVLVAATLMTLSASSTLQIWNQLSLGVLQQEQRQQLADRLDGELAALEASLRLQSQQAQPIPACGHAAPSLQALLLSRPAAAGVQRQLKLLDQEDGLLLELAIEGLPLRRQRLYLPAALGLCDAAAAAAPLAPPNHG